MPEPEIYRSLAGRFLDGAAASHATAHELAGFACYHAFECAGGAFVTHHGQRYPHAHKAKLNAFVSASRATRMARGVAYLAMKLNALRNLFLYPNPVGGAWQHPQDQMTPKQILDLHKRVRGIVNWVQGIVP